MDKKLPIIKGIYFVYYKQKVDANLVLDMVEFLRAVHDLVVLMSFSIDVPSN